MTTTLIGGQISAVMFTARGHNQVMNECHRETMEQIKTLYWPFHFMTAAYSRYPGVFAKRSKRYQMIKARTVHHQRPNEFSGDLRLAVIVDSIARATATRGTLEAKAPLTSVIRFGPKAGQTIRRPLTDQRRREMEFVSDDEIAEQSERMRAQYIASAYDPKYQDRVLKQFR